MSSKDSHFPEGGKKSGGIEEGRLSLAFKEGKQLSIGKMVVSLGSIHPIS